MRFAPSHTRNENKTLNSAETVSPRRALLLPLVFLSSPLCQIQMSVCDTTATNKQTLIQHGEILNENTITQVTASSLISPRSNLFPSFLPPPSPVSTFISPSPPPPPPLPPSRPPSFLSTTTIGKSSEAGLIVIQCLLLLVLLS